MQPHSVTSCALALVAGNALLCFATILTAEQVSGPDGNLCENLVFSQHFADNEAFNSTVFPFIRNPVAAMDYGPLVLNRRFARWQGGHQTRIRRR
ncbi:MAG: hypothetical protein MUC91_12925 [Verrucomicrobia bacterium]|nr:hypothetical protein [Verrucomicrobiota bacterium]